MKFVLDMIKGVFVGVANIIPGVSGGTMAVTMGIYDKLMHSLGNLFRQFKKSFFTLLPIIIGMAVGILAFSKVIDYTLEVYAFQTCMCFAGMIVGGLPDLVTATGAALRKEKHHLNPLHFIFFLLFAGVAVWMALMTPAGEGAEYLDTDWVSLLKLFGVGLVAAATMVIPGVSGSLVMMLLGYYAGILATISLFMDSVKGWNWEGIGHCVLALIPFAVGCILGILLVSKAITWLFKKFESITYCGILGLIAASLFAIFYKMKNPVFNTVSILVGIALFVGAAFLTYLLSFLSKKKAARK